MFIDIECDTWNMDPDVLEKAFEIYPKIKLVLAAHLYGFPGKVEGVKAECDRHDALLLENVSESMSAIYKGKQTGSFGNYGVISYNGNNFYAMESKTLVCNKLTIKAA